jgi:hypothetical protein
MSVNDTPKGGEISAGEITGKLETASANEALIAQA